MTILVIGGMHGNEPLGIELVKYFKMSPVEGIDVLYANENAVERNVRFIQEDLNRSFPGKLKSGEYELHRAAQILRYAKKYDIVLDFHNTHCPNNDCSFIGESASNVLPNISSYFGLEKVIIADYDCINKYASNCISIEISLSSKRMDTRWWYNKIKTLVQSNEVPASQNIETYGFAYRMTLEDRDRLRLPEANLVAFQEIDSNLAVAMGVQAPAFPIFINDAYTPYNYGGLLNKIDV